MLQCADELVVTLSELTEKHDSLKVDLLACIEAAQTVELCAGHQKTIIEDILTVSKLDSARLTITPVQTRPLLVMQNTMKMFEKEAGRNYATMSLKVYFSTSLKKKPIPPFPLSIALLHLTYLEVNTVCSARTSR